MKIVYNTWHDLNNNYQSRKATIRFMPSKTTLDQVLLFDGVRRLDFWYKIWADSQQTNRVNWFQIGLNEKNRLWTKPGSDFIGSLAIEILRLARYLRDPTGLFCWLVGKERFPKISETSFETRNEEKKKKDFWIKESRDRTLSWQKWDSERWHKSSNQATSLTSQAQLVYVRALATKPAEPLRV